VVLSYYFLNLKKRSFKSRTLSLSFENKNLEKTKQTSGQNQ
jgi:hypothetical protein